MYLVNVDPRCMVGRIYGTTSCGSHGFREDFLKCFLILNQSMASIDTRSVDGRNYVGDHKT